MGLYRRYCRFCWYGGKCVRFAVLGAYKSSLNWGGILGAGVLGALAEARGFSVIAVEGWQGVVASGLIYTAVAFLVIFLIRLVLIAPFVVHRNGQWSGPKFIYKEPKLAYYAYVTPADNNKPHQFRFLDAPPYSFIDYEIRFDTGAARDLTSICVQCVPKQLPKFESHRDLSYTSGGILVNRRRDMCLTTFLREDADPFSVRIYIKSWTEPV